jgi:hypothetical protein
LRSVVFLFGAKLIFDPEAVGDGVSVLVEACLESGHPPAEIISGGMAVIADGLGRHPGIQRLQLDAAGGCRIWPVRR